ncbi:alpha/beta hydrolase family esterase [Geminicoccus harenae]|uniref:alpha/beta hydrolase family esterase n=1 Tax=Geminicoccus harenae TaxID=2498453 RepID=UPI00168B434D|nr:polyhydroxybutyrate depolymerase [Geminicoccus harenae]
MTGALRLLVMLGWLAWSGTASACPGGAKPCEVEGGSYLMLLPLAGQDGPPPVLLHLHGWGGNAAAVLQAGFSQEFLARGFVVIAPQGLQSRPGGRTDWSVGDGQPHPRDDRAFVGRVLDDAARRFGLDRGRVLLSGFSRGASMAWDIACQEPAMALAYAPVAGGFWQKQPTTCMGPVRLLHTHGFADATVPLEGRVLRGGALAQADIFAGLALWRRVDGCDGPAEVPATADRSGASAGSAAGRARWNWRCTRAGTPSPMAGHSW